MTTMNDSIPDETWHVPVPYSCTLNVTDLGDTDDSDYHNIIQCKNTRDVVLHIVCVNSLVSKSRNGVSIILAHKSRHQP